MYIYRVLCSQGQCLLHWQLFSWAQKLHHKITGFYQDSACVHRSKHFFASSQLPNLLPNVKACGAEQMPAAEREKQDVLFYLIHVIASLWEILLKDQWGFLELRETLHLSQRALQTGRVAGWDLNKNLKPEAERAH